MINYEIYILPLIVAGLILAARVILGPTLVDRILAGDTLISVIAAISAIYALHQRLGFYLILAVVLLALSFMSTTIIGKYLEGVELEE